MTANPSHLRQWGPAVENYFLGQIDYETCLALQQRLVYEASGRDDGLISLLLCEHPPGITIGRLGSREHIHLSPAALTSRQLNIRWVNRGGGCLLHLPGQLAVYPIVPLRWHGWSVGEYLNRLQTALLATLKELGISGQTHPGQFGIWGRSGQLAVIGAAVNGWVTYHGAFINVNPAMNLFRLVESDPRGHTPMTSLVVERQQPVKMANVRSSLVQQFAAAFGCDRYHLYTGHPLLARLPRPAQESAARAI